MQNASDTDMSNHVAFFTAAMETDGGNTSATTSSSSSATLVQQFTMLEDAASKTLIPDLSEALSLPEEGLAMPTENQLENGQAQEGCAAYDRAYPCLMRACGLMKLLSARPSINCGSVCAIEPAIEVGAAANSNPTQTPGFETLITNNEQTIETINTMLRCPCVDDDDGCLLMTLCMLVFKLLDWYALAARNTSPAAAAAATAGADATPSVDARMDGYCLGGEDCGRMKAQLVLSKLFRVQQLVNQLSAKLKAQAGASPRGVGVATGNGVAAVPIPTASGSTPDRNGSGSKMGDDDVPPSAATTLFSAALSDQLAADLRKRLQSVSLEIVQRLKE
jgi:hypothetical protein